MPNFKPREVIQPYFKQDELKAVEDTVMTMRALRCASTSQDLRFISSLKSAFGSWFKRSGIEIPEKSQALETAKILGDAAGHYLARRAMDKMRTRTSDELFDQWQARITESRWARENFYQLTSARTIPGEVSRSVRDRFRCLIADPDFMMDWEFTEANNLGAWDYKHLASPSRLVIAPLSGDYLTLSMYQHYIYQRLGRAFQILPVSTSEDLTEMTVPENWEEVMADVDSIAIYLDTVETGRTAEFIHQSVIDLVGEDIKIHEPQLEPAEVMQSRKMMDFWRAIAMRQFEA